MLVGMEDLLSEIGFFRCLRMDRIGLLYILMLMTVVSMNQGMLSLYFYCVDGTKNILCFILLPILVYCAQYFSFWLTGHCKCYSSILLQGILRSINVTGNLPETTMGSSGLKQLLTFSGLQKYMIVCYLLFIIEYFLKYIQNWIFCTVSSAKSSTALRYCVYVYLRYLYLSARR